MNPARMPRSPRETVVSVLTPSLNRIQRDTGAIQCARAAERRVTLRLMPGGGHSMFTWRSLASPMLAWMTPRLTVEADRMGGRPFVPGGPGEGGAC